MYIFRCTYSDVHIQIYIFRCTYSDVASPIKSVAMCLFDGKLLRYKISIILSVDERIMALKNTCCGLAVTVFR